MNFSVSFILITCILFATAANAKQFYIPDGDVAALKTAINTANANNSTDTIHLAPYGIYQLTTADHTFVHGDDGLPIIRQDGNDNNYLTILGNGATILRANSIATLRLLYLLDCKVLINDVAFVNGTANNQGAAILVNGARPTISGCLFKGNIAEQGGAIYIASSSNVLIQNSTFTNNIATLGSGSAIVNYSGIVIIKKSTIVNNTCLNTSGPAAIFNYTPLNANSSANIYLQNSIVAGNLYRNITSPDNGKEFNIFGGSYTLGGNFIGRYPVVVQNVNPTTFAQGQPSAANDYVGTEAMPIDPKLGALGHNGQFVNSYALVPASKALLNNAGTLQVKLPTIASSGLVPSSALLGATFKIIGSNLSNISKVQFQGIAMTSGFTTSDTTITLVIPVGARTGKILISDASFNIALSNQEFTLITATSPDAPTNVTATPNGYSSIALHWKDGTNETGYQIEYKLSTATVFTIAGITTSNTDTYTINGLACNQAYTLRVAALGLGGPFYSPQVNSQLAGIAPPIITAPSTPACRGSVITLTAPDGFTSYTWTNGATSQSLDVTSSGAYAVKVSNSNGCESGYSSALAFTFHDYPDTVLTVNGATVTSMAGADNYQWYFNNSVIQGANSNEISMTQDGSYKVKITDSGCAMYSKAIPFLVLSAEVPFQSDVHLYPVPSAGTLTIDFRDSATRALDGTVALLNTAGSEVMHTTKERYQDQIQIETGGLTNGLYIIEILVGNKQRRERIVVNH